MDANFINFLNRIALGTIDKMGLMYLNQQCYSHIIDRYPVVTTKRSMVNFVNKRTLEIQVPPNMIYNDIPRGRIFSNDGYCEVEKDNRHLLEPVSYSIGVPVRFIKNDKALGITNGLTGTVHSIDPTTNTVRVSISQDKIVSCTPVNFEIYRLFFDYRTGKIENECVAVITRMPFILSYATTVHRCQGQTLEHMTFNSCSGCFAPGQLYTALTRVKNLQDLLLHVEIGFRDVIVSPAVLNYYNYFKENCEMVGEEGNIS
jgi:hypothetical protein